LESEDLTIEFDFHAIEKSKSDPAKSFEHCALAHKKEKEILVEPLVAAYLNLKWQSLKGWWYGYRVLFFLAFGVCLTFMISFIVEMNSTCTYRTTDNAIIPYNSSQLWKLENKTLKNKDGFWKSDDLWIFKPKDDDMFYIENTNETKVLESSDGKVNEEVKKENKAEQLWKKGELDASDKTQRWKLNGLMLENKEGTWKSDDDWEFQPQLNGLIYIENTSKTKVLGSTSDGKVIEEVKVEGKAEQLWKKGKPDAEGYITLQNSGEQKVLTAISKNSLKLKDQKFEKTKEADHSKDSIDTSYPGNTTAVNTTAITIVEDLDDTISDSQMFA